MNLFVQCRKEAQTISEENEEQQQRKDVSPVQNKDTKENDEVSPRVNTNENETPSKNTTMGTATGFLSSYNPMALVEAQVLLEQTKERARLEIQDLKDEINSVCVLLPSFSILFFSV
jgi:hypothetical protein